MSLSRLLALFDHRDQKGLNSYLRDCNILIIPYVSPWTSFTLLYYIMNYCCPVNYQTAQESFPKPFRIGLRAFILRKQAP